MRILLDTHAFLWFYSGDERLSSTGKAFIDDPTNECFLSIASVWEMGIKTSIGKLELRVDFAGLAKFMATNRIELLPISFEHIQQLQHLPFHHRDPFDRLLIAQALTENLTLLSRDTVFPQYGISLSW
jgi:PIN domain nuclease of toxin-antitoxin system